MPEGCVDAECAMHDLTTRTRATGQQSWLALGAEVRKVGHGANQELRT